MLRLSTRADLNIVQLEQMLSSKKSDLTRLLKQKKDLLKKLGAVETEIAKIGGASGGGRRGTRPHNEKSLPDTLDQVLRAHGGPMKVGDIADAVQATGYRSTSDNFRAIVNQTLIKERKRFVSSGQRGTYQLKK